MSNRAIGAVLVALAAVLLQGQQQDVPGAPLAGLSSRDLELFRLGRADFLEVETAEDGLGPIFNGTSCAQCHNIPSIGGTGTIVETRAGYRDEAGFHAPPGGTLMQLFSVPPHNCQVPVYADANVVGRRIAIPLFGAGLIDAIPDETLLALADPSDTNGDGIRGRAAVVEDVATGKKRIGRFGWKAQHATLLAFSGDAYINEMGITNDLFPKEEMGNVPREEAQRCLPSRSVEDVRNSRTGQRAIDNFENFMRFLAPPGRGPVDDVVLRGEHTFAEIGCAACHVPRLETGPNSNPVFNRKPVPLYSDLLLHDIGSGDGIDQASATGDEIRTPALWGLRFRRPLLHDGSAATIEAAIERHGEEAGNTAARFRSLSPDLRKELVAFLKSL